MYQIDSSGTAATQPTPSPAGTPGFFTGGNPATGTPATILDADWFNAVMMELINIVTAAGLTPAKGASNQVLTALRGMFAEKVNVANVAPVISKAVLGPLGANGSWPATATITAPCDGFVYATAAVNASAQFTGALSLFLKINSVTAASDTTLMSQTQYTWVAVTEGQVIEVQALATSGSTAPGQSASLIATALFVPSP
ncbi:hypothetical protein B0G84_4978 [Paraburkholderia sp. BL8N3]|nr:hypothetical protein [Paraburkholderia sp. BL8N3]TCK39638.1 hypothetical protein B0G84_4978 [Paraburkholderia sp. BL8N3]